MSSFKLKTGKYLTSLVLLLVLPTQAYAIHDAIQTCKLVTIAGDAQWVPYTIVSNDDSSNLSGIGFDIANQIFSELDVPVANRTFDNKIKLLHAMSTGEIDLVVSTYEHTDLANVAEILRPAYVHDPVSVLVKRSELGKVRSWEDLVGQQGTIITTLIPEKASSEYFSKYLNLSHTVSLLNILRGVENGRFDYAVGSNLQLNYAIKTNPIAKDLAVVKNLSKGGDVHMAFSKSSGCYHYATYLRKRLQDYKNNGKVEKIIKKYVQ